MFNNSQEQVLNVFEYLFFESHQLIKYLLILKINLKHA